MPVIRMLLGRLDHSAVAGQWNYFTALDYGLFSSTSLAGDPEALEIRISVEFRSITYPMTAVLVPHSSAYK
jgi:hypothetical protein